MKYIIAFILSVLSINVGIAYGAIGCMDNSWHIQKQYDNKTYHYVECYCPCQRNKMLRDGTCSRCFHRHQPKSHVFVSANDAPKTTVARKASGKKLLQLFNPKRQEKLW